MSLVHEALQKAEREKLRKAGVAPAAPIVPQPTPVTVASRVAHEQPVAAGKPLPQDTQIPSQVTKPSKESSGLLTVLLSLVALVALVAIVFLVSRTTFSFREPEPPAGQATGSTGNNPPSVEPPDAVAPGTSAATPASTPTATTDTSAYKLSGIMDDPDGKWSAVLNGRVVYEGYQVDGATVKKIERNRVLLDIAGREAELRLF